MAVTSYIGQGLASSLTGNVNKAYILMHEPKITTKDSLGASQSLGSMTALPSVMSDMASALDSAGNSLGVASVTGADKMITTAAKTAGYIAVRVQFNPSSISFTGQGGQIKRESVGGSGENQFQQVDIPSETVMTIELYFDDLNNMDAFMSDSLNVYTPGGVYQNIKAVANYSVRDISELFVAAMVQSYTRIVGFVWNKMTFWGEMVGANCQFTMFNKKGEPIRSKVTLQIRQDQAVSANGVINPYATEKQWIKAFNDMFKADTGKGLMGNENKASNLLNF